jgi:hypothetical protein
MAAVLGVGVFNSDGEYHKYQWITGQPIPLT